MKIPRYNNAILRYNFLMNTKIIYEDESIIVYHKPAGFPVQTKKLGQPDVETELKNYLKGKTPGGGAPYLGIVHRLDQPVEGLMVVAKTAKVAATLSAAVDHNENKKEEKVPTGKMIKIYRARIFGEPEKEAGYLEHFLKKEERTNLSVVVSTRCDERVGLAGANENPAGKKTKNPAKKARLYYAVTGPGEVLVRLYTGRHHQIRVQFAAEGTPLLGDTKYGTEASVARSRELGMRNVALKAVYLAFSHPKSGKPLEFFLPGEEPFREKIEQLIRETETG